MKNPELLQPNNIEAEREQKWAEIRQGVEKITDKLGKGIDEGIKESVTSLLAHEFPTSQSCAGHIGERGASSPWVEIYVPGPKGWKEDEEKQQEWTAENLKQQKRMIDFLAEFYQDRKTSFDARINFRYIGVFGGFRIQSMGSDIMSLWAPEEQKRKSEDYRKEMSDFTDFLKKLFFEK